MTKENKKIEPENKSTPKKKRGRPPKAKNQQNKTADKKYSQKDNIAEQKQVQDKPKPKRGRPPKAKSQQNKTADKKYSQKDNIAEQKQVQDKPKPKRGRPPKAKTQQNKTTDKKYTQKDNIAEQKQVQEKPKPKSGRPPEAKIPQNRTADKKYTQKDNIAEQKQVQERPKPKRGRPPKAKKDVDTTTKKHIDAIKEQQQKDTSKIETPVKKSVHDSQRKSTESSQNQKQVQKPQSRSGKPPKYRKEVGKNTGNVHKRNNAVKEQPQKDHSGSSKQSHQKTTEKLPRYQDGAAKQKLQSTGKPQKQNDPVKQSQQDRAEQSQRDKERAAKQKLQSAGKPQKQNDPVKQSQQDRAEQSQRDKERAAKQKLQSAGKPQKQNDPVKQSQQDRAEQSQRDKERAAKQKLQSAGKPQKQNDPVKQSSPEKEKIEERKSDDLKIDPKNQPIKDNKQNKSKTNKQNFNSNKPANKQETKPQSKDAPTKDAPKKIEPPKPHENKIGEFNVYRSDNEKNIENKKVVIPNIKVPAINLNKLMRSTQKHDPAIEKVLKETEDFLFNEIFVDKDVHVVAAVSGGVDSVTLLDVLVQMAFKMGFDLSVAHYNHSLRGSTSDEDADFVKALAKDYGVPFYTSKGNVKQYAEKNSLSIEQAARKLRYNFFERTTRTLNANFLLTAHTADDSTETFLINLFRGSGLTGLSGIPTKRQFVKNVIIARPFINLTKRNLIDYAEMRYLHWKEDETNKLLFYTRNKIRHELLPLLKKNYTPAVIDVINRTAKLINGADEVISDYVADNLDSILGQSSNEKFEIKINLLKTFNEFIQGELIQASVKKYFRFELGTMNKIDRILSLMDANSGAIYELNSNYFVLKDREYLIFTKNEVDEDENLLIEGEGEHSLGKTTIQLTLVNKRQIRYNKDSNIEFIAADDLPPILELRKWQQGDKFQPLGMQGSINMSDFLTNNKVSLIDKQSITVLTNKVDIIWVPGMRISEKFKIQKDTKKVFKAEVIDNPLK